MIISTVQQSDSFIYLYSHLFIIHTRVPCMLCAQVLNCVWLCDPMDCSLPGSSIHGILQARILEWVAMPSFRGSSRGSSWPRDRTCISGAPTLAGGYFITWEAPTHVPILFPIKQKNTFNKYVLYDCFPQAKTFDGWFNILPSDRLLIEWIGGQKSFENTNITRQFLSTLHQDLTPNGIAALIALARLTTFAPVWAVREEMWASCPEDNDVGTKLRGERPASLGWASTAPRLIYDFLRSFTKKCAWISTSLFNLKRRNMGDSLAQQYLGSVFWNMVLCWDLFLGPHY